MLVVDAILTLITWMPYNIYSTVFQLSQVNTQYSRDEHIKGVQTFQILSILMLTNVFSTRIVYAIFNRNFRVSNSYLQTIINGLALEKW